MILTVENTTKAGRRCKLFDGTGQQIMRCTWCDTDTGECEIISRNEDGRWVLSEDGRTVQRERKFYDRPIRVEWQDVAVVDGGG